MGRILHILSQIPSKTGSGIFLDNILIQGHMAGHIQGLVLGLPSVETYQPQSCVSYCKTVFFETEELPFKIPGMSDVMPYPSTKFSELSEANWKRYTTAFENAISSAISDFKPDVILSNHLWAATAIATQLVRQQKLSPAIKIYGVSHGTDLRQLSLAPYLKDFIIENCSKLDGVFCLHQGLLESIQQLYTMPLEKLHISGNGYNAQVFKRYDRMMDSTLKIIYAGKLSLSKGVLELIDAVNGLNESLAKVTNQGSQPKTCKAVRLYLAGKGSGYEEELILKAAAKSPYIECLGFLNQQALAEVFYQSNLFVLPSYYEGLPLVVLEALATGLPVVVTNLPGLKDWLGDDINHSGFIRYVDLPELEGVDQCKKAAREPFVKDLTAALEYQMDQIINQSYTADFPYDAIESHSWEAVFKLIALETGL